MIKQLKGTNNNYLTLSAYDLKLVKQYMGASFVVQPDFKSHNRAIMTVGKGEMQSVFSKQKLNTSSSIEAYLVAVDDASV